MISRSAEGTDIDAAYAGTVYDQLNRMARLYILRAFKETGVLRSSGEQYRVPDLKEKMGVISEYGRLFDCLLIILENAGFISRSDDRVTALDPAGAWGVEEISRAAGNLQQEIAKAYPEMAATARSLARCMDKYAAVLTGRMNPTEALFPNGSMELVENLYTNNHIQDFFNRLVGQTVREWVTRAAAETRSPEIRILEVGAGTGSTTGHILRELDGIGNCAYCYSDIASVFTQYGKRKFGAGYPFMQFKTLNIEEDVEAQGFERASWDVVIASNVLHATARIDRTLGQVRKLLKPGGVLIMNEVTKFQEIVNVIFGLTGGWWLFEDPESRIAHCPTLSLAGWKAGLEDAGFVQVHHAGLPDDSEESPMQCVILAESGSAGVASGRADSDREPTPAPIDDGRTPAATGAADVAPSPSGRRERITAEVKELMYQASEIEIAGADGDTNLFELGFASLMIARLKDLIKRTYGLDVQMSWFYSRLDTFNKTVAYIDNESDPDGEPAPGAETAAGEAIPPAAARATRIEGDADSIIGRQLELMDRQLTVMSEQLAALAGTGKGARTEQPGSQAAPIAPVVQRGAGVGVRKAEPRQAKPFAPALKKREEYVAYRGVTAREKLELNNRQREHLKSLIGRYTGLTRGSKELTAQYRPVFANTRNIAGFRPEWKEMIYQIIVKEAAGSHFTDIDGRDYLDISMGFGVYLFGHNPPFVQAALLEELRRGMPIGPISELAGKAATLVHELAGVERVAFFNTGTEAVMAALRIARTVTGRKKIALFATSYHGHFDGVLAVKDYDGPMGAAAPMSPGTPSEMVHDVCVLDYGSDEALRFIEEHGRELAAVLVEPVQSRRPDLQPRAFLEKVRELTTVSGSALIFDEMIIGFRIHPGGGQAWFGIRADIVTYGKVIGGGLPIGVVAGKAQYLDAVDGGMWSYGDTSFPERENTFIAGTFNHHPLAMAGANAVLSHLKEAGPSLQATLNRRTGELAERLNGYFADEGLPIVMDHFGSLFHIRVKGDQELLYYHLLCRGVYIWEGRNCFLSTAHTDGDIEYLVNAIQESVAEMRAGGLFPALPPRGAPGTGTASQGFPLSSAQKRVYALSQLEGGELSYHTPVAFFLDGAIDPAEIERCLRTLIERHDALRTGFEMSDGDLHQWIEERCPFALDYREAKEGELAALTDAFIRSFDLSRPPLVRCLLAKISERRHFFLLDTHHCVFDGMSGDILIGELLKLLDGEPLPQLAARYRDYVAREQAYLESEEFRKDEAFWMEALSGDQPALRLPTDWPRPARRTFQGDRIFHTIGSRKTEALKRCSARSGSSLFMTLFAAYAVLLHKLTGQEDITVGTTYDARKDDAFKNVIGMFVNTVAVRNHPEKGKTFKAFLDEVKRNILEAFDRQDYPFERIVENLRLRREADRNPLFDTLFVYEPVETKSATPGGCTISKYDIRNKTAMFDLSLEILEIDGTLDLSLEFNTDIYAQETAERYLGYYEKILDDITPDPAIRLEDLELLSGREKKRIIEEFNDTAAAYPEARTIAALFEEQASRTPERTALVCASRRLTYRELNERANETAHELRRRKLVRPDDVVGVLMERSEWMIAAILGILKAGGAWLPIEPRYPAGRIRFMLEDSGSRVVLTDEKFRGILGNIPAGSEVLDIRTMQGESNGNPVPVSGPRNLAYVIYTSGSTGKPKGVMIEQYSVVNNCWGMENYRSSGEPYRVGFTTSSVFDASVQEMFGSLLFGHCLHVIPEEILEDGPALAAYIHRQRLDVIDCTPTLFSALVQSGLFAHDDLALRQVLFGGEALPWSLLDRAAIERTDKAGRPLEIVNLYGPTECCIDATLFRVTAESRNRAGIVPIGKPKANTRIYLLDAAMKPVPVGVEGEIWIAGHGVGRGYAGQPALTAEKFIANPYRPGERMYRTGDLGRWLDDGNIAYCGRGDEQVKVRGYRIECGEIEHRLLEHPLVTGAAVLAQGAGERGPELTAYCVAAGEMNVRELRSFLKESLPDYMVPARFVTVARLPLTTNGKVDRKALLRSGATDMETGTRYVPPRTAEERVLCGIWEQVLGCGSVGIDANFFDLGGDSIKAIQTVSRLSRENLKIEVREIFASPTIRELAVKLTPKVRIAEQGEISGRVPLTAIQAWYFRAYRDHLDHHYTQAVLLSAHRRIDEPALRQAMAALQEHHDALRMSYRGEQGGIVQEMRTTADCPLSIETIDLRGKEGDQKEIKRRCSEVPESMRMSGPMMRTVLLRGASADHLCIVIHHLVVDGVSWRILIEDLETGYEQALQGNAIYLPQKTDPFKQWAEHIREYGLGPKLTEEIPFWRTVEEAATDRIPADVPAASNRYEDMATVGCELGEEETAMLMTTANRAYRTETKDLLLVALGRALKKLFGITRSVIDLEGHGREAIAGAIDVARTVGWFTTLYPFVLDLKDDAPADQIRDVKEALRRIPANGIGYGILHYLTPPEKTSGLSFGLAPQILFNYLGGFDGSAGRVFQLDGAGIDNTIAPRMDRSHELELEGAVVDGRLRFSLGYNAKAFRRETMKTLLDAYAKELRSISRHCTGRKTSVVTPHDLTFSGLTPKELDRLLADCGLAPDSLKDLYPLSPLQEGILYHERLENGSPVYFQQTSCRIDGPLDIRAFEAAWNRLIDRHDILRTIFVHKGLERPLQVVAKETRIDLRCTDISVLSAEQQDAHLAGLLDEDRKEGFSLSRAVPMRVAVIKRSDTCHEIIWSTHGILLDGWCTGILLTELLAAYASFERGQEPVMKPAAQYGRYIGWLEGLDPAGTIAYWKGCLDGYDRPAVLPKVGTGDRGKPFRAAETAVLELDNGTTGKLKRLASENRVTLNTVIQAAWGVLLSRYAGVDDVVFGATVSGRPGDLPDVEEMVGLFINAIPVRVRMQPDQKFTELMKELQQETLKHQAYHYCSLADIQAATSLKQELLDHVLVFENYPLAEELVGLEQRYRLGFSIGEVKAFEQTNYDLTVIVEPGEKMRVEFRYNPEAFPERLMEQVKETFGAIIGSVIADAQIRIGDLRLSVLSAEERRERDAYIRSAAEINEDF